MPRVLLFTKLPQPGRVKTRLGAQIGMEQAAAWHRALVLDLLAQLGPEPAGCPLVLALDQPGDPTPLFEASGFAVPLYVQRGGDLGQRLANAHEDMGGADAGNAVIFIGSDCPLVTPDLIGEAARALEETDLVLGPAEDGGYYLLGLARQTPAQRLLSGGIRWSSPHALADTLSNAQGLGLTFRHMLSSFDIDDAASLGRFVSLMRQSPGAAARWPNAWRLAEGERSEKKL